MVMAMINRLADESDRAWMAFQDFLEMGPARSLEQLRQRYIDRSIDPDTPNGTVPTKSKATFKKWSSRFNWYERAKEWDLEQEARRREHLQEQQRIAWEQEVNEFQEQNKILATKAFDVAFKLLQEASKALESDPEEEPLLDADQAIKAIAAIAKVGEFAQSTQATALGVAQLLQELNKD